MFKKYTILSICILLAFVSCKSNDETVSNNQIQNSDNTEIEMVSDEIEPTNDTGLIYLYGEYHGQEKILQKELELWIEHYNEDGMRHLFIESPYFKAQLLNIWMTEENDDILVDVMGTNGDLEAVLNFYRSIKKECPETIFHGNDVNGYKSFYPGIEYRKYLEENNLTDTEMYKKNEEAIEQVKHYNVTGDDIYREQMLVENFMREFNSLNNESVMGIYGLAHVKKSEFTKDSYTVNSMANQLTEIYGDRVITTDLSGELLKGLLEEPISIGEIEVGSKVYKAEYYGMSENTGSELIKSFEYWKLIDSYEDFKNSKQLDMIIYAYNYPMKIEENNIYMIVATLKDDTTMTYYAIADGSKVDNLLITKQISVD